ncbi:PREDICTED: V-type proton ATPase subunit G 3 isoform X2 [Nanorana parkeri]|uniref:V-type proton ATPase subunit G 3 isoform X2 n=1 Tax=Nanorana parkeri TaxID=125878 RepID=UPI0008542335|nr:PREDICTED: V-type proton ATPase subunit G 3 isoform X2 [Nanorana parkeri]
MATQSQGIQQLLQAEKRAKDKLEEAKKRKNKRLRQAKEEMQAYNSNYQKFKEKVLKELLDLAYDVRPELHINYKFKH